MTAVRHGRHFFNFNPRPPRGGRRFCRPSSPSAGNFNPRPPRGGRRIRNCPWCIVPKFQSTPPARGATAKTWQTAPPHQTISIHAPREGGDCWRRRGTFCGRSFQSTPPARGATVLVLCVGAGRGDFNPRPPRGGRHCVTSLLVLTFDISIHAPREGGDTVHRILFTRQSRFQSTPPARGATAIFRRPPAQSAISIHAPREGGDHAVCQQCPR